METMKTLGCLSRPLNNPGGSTLKLPTCKKRDKHILKSQIINTYETQTTSDSYTKLRHLPFVDDNGLPLLKVKSSTSGRPYFCIKSSKQKLNSPSHRT